MSYKKASPDELKEVAESLYEPLREEFDAKLKAVVSRLVVVERAHSQISAKLEAMQRHHEMSTDKVLRAVADLENSK